MAKGNVWCAAWLLTACLVFLDLAGEAQGGAVETVSLGAGRNAELTKEALRVPPLQPNRLVISDPKTGGRKQMAVRLEALDYLISVPAETVATGSGPEGY
jgi:hypothetical protein